MEADNHDTAQFIIPLAPPQHHILSLNTAYVMSGSHDSVVGIMTCNELDGSGFEPPWEKDQLHQSSSAPRPTKPPTQGVPGLFLRGIRQLGYGFDHPLPSSTEANIRVELYLYPTPPCYRVNFTFVFTFLNVMHRSVSTAGFVKLGI